MVKMSDFGCYVVIYWPQYEYIALQFRNGARPDCF